MGLALDRPSCGIGGFQEGRHKMGRQEGDAVDEPSWRPLLGGPLDDLVVAKRQHSPNSGLQAHTQCPVMIECFVVAPEKPPGAKIRSKPSNLEHSGSQPTPTRRNNVLQEIHWHRFDDGVRRCMECMLPSQTWGTAHVYTQICMHVWVVCVYLYTCIHIDRWLDR